MGGKNQETQRSVLQEEVTEKIHEERNEKEREGRQKC